MSAPLPAPAPHIASETKPFWDATLVGRLLLKRCHTCGAHHWYPRAICPFCGSSDTAWVEATGRGRVYSFSVVRRGIGAYKDATPYVLALVELDEGVRVTTNIVGVDPEAVAVGDRVGVVFHDTGAGAALPRFRPVAEPDDPVASPRGPH